MALIIPDSIPSKASQGEKTLYYTLRGNLSYDYLVWYEPRVNSVSPHFIILFPHLNIIRNKGGFQ